MEVVTRMLLLVCSAIVLSSAFQAVPVYQKRPIACFTSPHRLNSINDKSSDEENDATDFSVRTDDESDSLLRALKERQIELKNGIGKRYITRTQKGFLNVHETVCGWHILCRCFQSSNPLPTTSQSLIAS